VWRLLLTVGAVLSLIVAVVGAVYAWRNWLGGSALGEPAAMRRYGIIVGVEFGIAVVGAAVIALCGGGEYIAAWVCLVVGVHFWPMASVLKSPSLVALGALLTGVAVGAVLVSRTTAVATSAITGAGARAGPTRPRQLGCAAGHRVVRANRNYDYAAEQTPPVSSAGQQ
jgi:hypothetical protein